VRRGVPIALAALALLYGTRTISRNRDWRTEEALYLRTLEAQPDAQIIRTNLGALYFDRGDLDAAEREWQTALGPRRPYASTLNNLGLLRARQKRYGEAMAYFERALRERPTYMSPHKNLAAVYVEMGRPADAERELRTAVELAPLSAGARNEFGKFLLARGRPAEARQQFALSAQADPNSEALIHLGDLLASAGELDSARAAYRDAVALNPFDSRAQFGLAALEERAGRVVEALRGYRTGLETDPGNAQALQAVHRLTRVNSTRPATQSHGPAN
jgi:Tfp pilus assembly protein PilF